MESSVPEDALSLLIFPGPGTVPSMWCVLHTYKALFKDREGIWDFSKGKREFTFHWGDERSFLGGKHCLCWTIVEWLRGERMSQELRPVLT